MATNKRKIGAVISLDGESQFKRQVQSCNASLKTMRSEMSMVTEQFKGQANSVEALEAKHSTLEKTLSESTKLQDTLQDALENAQKNYEKAGSSLSGYEEQLANARKALEELEKQQSDNADESLVKQVQDQRAEMEQLENVVKRAQTAYAKAGDSVQAWQRQLNETKTSVMKLSAEIAENDRYLEEARQSADATAHSIDAMGKQVKETSHDVKETTSDTTQAVEDLTSATAEFFTTDMIVEYADNVAEKFQALAEVAWESAQQIDEAYDLIAKKTGATGQDLEQYKHIINNIYADVPAEMGEIADAVGAVSQRFKAPSTEVEQLSTKMVKFAKITDEDVTETLRGAGRVLTAFGDGMEGADTLLDTLLASAQDKGVQIDEVLENTLTNANAFKKLDLSSSGAVRFMGSLMEAGVEAEGAVSSLETAYDNCMENGKDFKSELLRVNDALKDGSVSTQDMADAQELFGDAFAKIADAIASGNIDFRYLIENMNDLSGISGRVDKTFDETVDSTDDITVAVSNLKSALGKLTKDGFRAVAPLVEDFADIVSDVNESLEDTPDVVKKTVGVVGLLATGCGILAPKIFAVKTALDGLKTAKDIAQTLHTVADATDDVADVANITATSVGATGKSFASVAKSAGPYVALVAGSLAVLKGLQMASDKYVEDMKSADASLANLLDTSDTYTQQLDDVKNRLAETVDKSNNLEVLGKAQVAQPLVDSLSKLGKQSYFTVGELGLMEDQVRKLNDVYPDLDLSIDKSTKKFHVKGQEIKDLSSYMDTYMKKIEDTARKEILLSLKKDQVEAEIDFEVSKSRMGELKKQMEKELAKAGIGSLEEFQKMNPLKKAWLNMNPVDGLVDTELFYRLKEEYDELNDKQHELNDSYIASEERVKALEKAIQESSVQMDVNATATKKSAESWTGAGAEVDAYAQKYVDLGVKLKSFDGDIEGFRNSFTEEEEALRNLFDTTVVVWQNSYDSIMSGLGQEVISLTDSMGAWQAYRDEVGNSINSVSTLFQERQKDDETTWTSMTDGLISNADAYNLWNENVNAVLESARYKNDEAFRQIANSIMLSGIDSAEYLDNFVQNVNLKTTEAKDDISKFTDLNTETEQYASQMATLKTATEESMSGIAWIFDATKTEAQRSLEELSASLTEKSEEYTAYSDNAKNLVESERYKTDESFRTMVNTMLQQGMAGAGVLAELWTAMESGNGEVDTLLSSFQNFETAMGGFADVTASTETALQQGMDSMVSIVSNSGEAFRIAMVNDEVLMASGVTGEHLTSAVDSAISKSLERITSENMQSQAEDAGEQIGKSIATGIENGMNSVLNPQEIKSSNKQVSKWDYNPQDTDRSKYPSVTNQMNLTVNQQKNGWWGEITDWIRKSLS